MTKYTCWGSVTGDCGHEHRSIRAAVICKQQHSRGCRRQGGYSDRSVRALDSGRTVHSYDVTRGPGRHLDDDEMAEMHDLYLRDQAVH